MRHFIIANYYQTWKQIENGPYKIEKDMANSNSHDLDLIALNANTMHTILSALCERQCDQVQDNESAKEIWDKLDELYGQPLEKELEKDDLLDESSPSVTKRISNFRFQDQTMR
ncbi:Uncharacterized protein TCM_013473 [Theobroma cacao]|uniref:Uncharacterized protein n=1 Tax=Theobroma cacao TaxID=3641 RepID=A0A061FX11_THECC|nr:Uncharacterized protein TCM_013473 [Theobroma cacao]